MPPRPPSDDSDEQSSDDELTDWPPTDSGQPDSNPPWILLGVGGLVAVAIGWFFRPWLHGLIYTVYTTPLLLLWYRCRQRRRVGHRTVGRSR